MIIKLLNVNCLFFIKNNCSSFLHSCQHVCLVQRVLSFFHASLRLRIFSPILAIECNEFGVVLVVGGRFSACQQGRRIPLGEVECARRCSPVSAIPPDSTRTARHAQPWLGSDHQHRIGAQCQSIAVQSCLRISQAWSRRSHKGNNNSRHSYK